MKSSTIKMPPAPKATHLNTTKLSSEERPSSYMATFSVQREWSYERGWGLLYHRCNKVLLLVNNRYSRLQELIAEQSEISAENQILIFEGEYLLTLIESEISPVETYPKTINENTPIYVFSKIIMEPKAFQSAVYRKYNTCILFHAVRPCTICNTTKHFFCYLLYVLYILGM